MKQYLIQTIYYEDEVKCRNKIMNEHELIGYVDMADCYDDVIEFKVYDISFPGVIIPLKYRGWQPGRLIEFVNSKGDVVISGYGTDH